MPSSAGFEPRTELSAQASLEALRLLLKRFASTLIEFSIERENQFSTDSLVPIDEFLRRYEPVVQSQNRTPWRSRSQRAVGGAERIRTDDPRLAKPVLSQLSYSPFVQEELWGTLDSN